jgi:hypothetical protein
MKRKIRGMLTGGSNNHSKLFRGAEKYKILQKYCDGIHIEKHTRDKASLYNLRSKADLILLPLFWIY